MVRGPIRKLKSLKDWVREPSAKRQQTKSNQDELRRHRRNQEHQHLGIRNWLEHYPVKHRTDRDYYRKCHDQLDDDVAVFQIEIADQRPDRGWIDEERTRLKAFGL